MKYAKSLAFLTIRFWVVAASLCLSTAYADDYSDALQLLRSGKYADALARADQHLSAQPKDPQMRFLKGVIQREMGKTPEAIATFTRLTEEYPELPEPYNNLAVLYAGQSQFEKARSALEMAIRTNPSYTTAHENLGDVYAKLASEAYNKALLLDNTNTAVAPKLALIRELFNPAGAKGQRGNTAPATTPTIPPAASTTASTSNSNAAPTNKPATTAPSNSVATKPATNPSPAASATSNNNTPSNPAANDNAVKDVELAVKNWAAAWSAKDVKNYLNAYGKTFEPPGGMSRTAWEEERHSRIMGKSSISVKLSNIATTVSGNKATVRFSQAYKANEAVFSSRKVLELVKTGDQWKIVKESVSN